MTFLIGGCLRGFLSKENSDPLAGIGFAPDTNFGAGLQHHVVADNCRQLHLSLSRSRRHEERGTEPQSDDRFGGPSYPAYGIDRFCEFHN
jgi:hypothetical protein